MAILFAPPAGPSMEFGEQGLCCESLRKTRASATGPQGLFVMLSNHTDGGIAYDHLRNLRLRNPGEVLGNLLPRVREGTLGMRIVGTPHQTLHTDQFPGEVVDDSPDHRAVTQPN